MRFGILIFDEVEVLDCCGPFEVFSVAARLRAREEADGPITVTLVSAYPERTTVAARGGMRITADATIADAPDFEVLVVPGGVTAQVEQDAAVTGWIASRASTPTIASVCTGAFLLARSGILTEGAVTTHWEDQADLAERFPQLIVIHGPRWVQQGRLYTSAGISAGLDLSLHLIGLVDPTLPARVARQMDYAWHDHAIDIQTG